MQYQRPVLIQEQKLKLSPQLYQSIQLMAMPIQELRSTIQEELEKNPALDILEDRSTVSLNSLEKKQKEEESYFENSSDPGYRSRGYDQEASDSKQNFLEGAVSKPESLQEHLLWQLRLQKLSAKARLMGENLIQNLDPNGFHREPPSRFISDPGDEGLLKEMTKLIQQFDPVGTCTADYAESLLVQVRLDPEAPAGAEEMLTAHRELLEKKKIADLSRKLGIRQEETEAILRYLQTLTPFPGHQYSSEETTYVTPDLMVTMVNGEFLLKLNDDGIPVLGINPYFDELTDQQEEPEARKFARNQVRDAQWFIRSVGQRNQTLVKIAKSIVEFQRNFFMKGPKHLVPLTLKDVAEEVSVHETTVSRISNAKYIQTEWGIYPLKHFFTNSISGTGSSGSRFSKEGVKETIREILEEHQGPKKLSDQKLAEILKTKGISIARRTVAKYRNELKIRSSYDR